MRLLAVMGGAAALVISLTVIYLDMTRGDHPMLGGWRDDAAPKFLVVAAATAALTVGTASLLLRYLRSDVATVSPHNERWLREVARDVEALKQARSESAALQPN
jgi:hypothetical protein